jgi:aminomethyltransferase
MEQLKRTPLFAEHERLEALLAPFGGWEMPIQYPTGIIAEHRWCREQAALFDICHMGEFLYEGDLESGGLEGVFTFSVKSIPVGRSRYGFLLNENGGVIDDLIVFRLAQDKVMVVVNAATISNDFQVISSRLTGTAGFSDISDATAKLDLQGPQARAVLTRFFGDDPGAIPYFTFTECTLLGVKALVSRTGYTGELGYEIFLPAGKVEELWNLFLSDERVKPAGLGARDLLRLEVGYSLYGSDIDEVTSPLEAGLSSFVNFNKEFIGKEKLLKQREEGTERGKIAFKVNSRRSPRHGYDIYSGGEKVGVVTSGAFSPMLGCGIGIGFVPPDLTAPGSSITICHEKVSMEATICTLPFYRDGSLRS